jgi:hypothetical protein
MRCAALGGTGSRPRLCHVQRANPLDEIIPQLGGTDRPWPHLVVVEHQGGAVGADLVEDRLEVSQPPAGSDVSPADGRLRPLPGSTNSPRGPGSQDAWRCRGGPDGSPRGRRTQPPRRTGTAPTERSRTCRRLRSRGCRQHRRDARQACDQPRSQAGRVGARSTSTPCGPGS